MLVSLPINCCVEDRIGNSLPIEKLIWESNRRINLFSQLPLVFTFWFHRSALKKKKMTLCSVLDTAANKLAIFDQISSGPETKKKKNNNVSRTVYSKLRASEFRFICSTQISNKFSVSQKWKMVPKKISAPLSWQLPIHHIDSMIINECHACNIWSAFQETSSSSIWWLLNPKFLHEMRCPNGRIGNKAHAHTIFYVFDVGQSSLPDRQDAPTLHSHILLTPSSAYNAMRHSLMYQAAKKKWNEFLRL